MNRPLFKGVITALITPFRDGKVDEAAFRLLLERQIEGGVDGVVPVGTTGESATVSADEHKRIVELCVEIAAGRVRVIAGAGASATDKAIDLVRHAKTVGADGALVVTPYYNRPSQDGLYAHFAAINDAVQLPVLLYNVPGRTGVDLADATTARLAELPNIVGIKDATGDLPRASLQRLECGEDWVMLSGNDDSALGYMAHGGHGCISVTCNVAPELVSRFYEDCMAGRYQDALYGQDRLMRLHKALFADASPSPTKFALAHLGLCREEGRLPLVPCSEAARAEVLAAMRDAGLI